MSEKKLNVTGEGLETLPPLPKGIQELYCADNNLTQLPELPEGLQKLVCIGNQLTELPVLPNSIKQIAFDGNPLRPPYDTLYKNYKRSTSPNKLATLNLEIIKQKIKDLMVQLRGISAYKVAVAVPQLSKPASENASGAGAGPAEQRMPYIIGETGNINSVVLSFISGKEGSVDQQKQKLLKDVLQLKQKYFKLTGHQYNQNAGRDMNEMEYQDYDYSYIPTTQTMQQWRRRNRQNYPENPQGGRRKARLSRKGRKTRKQNWKFVKV